VFFHRHFFFFCCPSADSCLGSILLCYLPFCPPPANIAYTRPLSPGSLLFVRTIRFLHPREGFPKRLFVRTVFPSFPTRRTITLLHFSSPSFSLLPLMLPSSLAYMYLIGQSSIPRRLTVQDCLFLFGLGTISQPGFGSSPPVRY